MNIISIIEKEEINKLSKNKSIKQFSTGDTVKVIFNLIEGNRKRIQEFEGIIISKKNKGITSSFIVRKISFGESVERSFYLYSPYVISIKIKHRGYVRRAKLYYIRKLKGKHKKKYKKTIIK